MSKSKKNGRTRGWTNVKEEEAIFCAYLIENHILFKFSYAYIREEAALNVAVDKETSAITCTHNFLFHEILYGDLKHKSFQNIQLKKCIVLLLLFSCLHGKRSMRRARAQTHI